jgi:hypothetical protein
MMDAIEVREERRSRHDGWGLGENFAEQPHAKQVGSRLAEQPHAKEAALIQWNNPMQRHGRARRP